jgi:hypothetical protein
MSGINFPEISNRIDSDLSRDPDRDIQWLRIVVVEVLRNIILAEGILLPFAVMYELPFLQNRDYLPIG